MEWIMFTQGDDKKSYCRYCKAEIREQHGELVSQAKIEGKNQNTTSCSNV